MLEFDLFNLQFLLGPTDYARNFTYYAMLCCTAQNLPIMLKLMLNIYLLCSNLAQYFILQFPCFANKFAIQVTI